MKIPTGNPDEIGAAIHTILNACNETPSSPTAANIARADLPPLSQALEQLLDVMVRVESDAQATAGGSRTSEIGTEEITEIGEYAFRLHENLVAVSEQAGMTDQRETLAGLAVAIALWVAGHGGRIDTLEPVVDGLALLANTTMEADRLTDLSKTINRITIAISPFIQQDLEKTNPGRPWRVLLLNQAIVATRSHNTELMESAFALLTEHLPEDAARFFTEGMEQMDALDYPAHVRKVMEKYHRQWAINRTLH
jgi:hypothetical protein